MYPNIDKKCFKDENFYIVSGHTPSLAINSKSEIYKSHNNICIDCEAAFNSKLSCLYLYTMKKSYI